MEWLSGLLHNTWFVGCAMATLIFIITELIKQPIKKFTSAVIKNERFRKMANIVILLIPFALGVVAEFLFKTFYLETAFNGITGLHYGTAAVTLYGIIERFFYKNGIKIENPYNTEEGKAVTDFVEEVAQDGKLDEKDIETAGKLISNIKVDPDATIPSEPISKPAAAPIAVKKPQTAVDDFLNKVK